MVKRGEYQGGFYAIILFIGLYIRYYIFKILKKNKSINYLSGEVNFPKLNEKQRFYCLIVGLIFSLFVFIIVVCLVYLMDTYFDAACVVI